MSELTHDKKFDILEALFYWFESKGISAKESVPICCLAIAAVIRAGGEDDERWRKDGIEIVCDMIREAVEATDEPSGTVIAFKRKLPGQR